MLHGRAHHFLHAAPSSQGKNYLYTAVVLIIDEASPGLVIVARGWIVPKGEVLHRFPLVLVILCSLSSLAEIQFLDCRLDLLGFTNLLFPMSTFRAPTVLVIEQQV
jgi:hypothetical protein